MTIQQCKYVLEIARCGSFNEAAKKLFVAQSGLSSSVKALEKELNIKIFERSANGTYLTAEGAEFVRYATQITQQHNFIVERYNTETNYIKLYVSTQHYDFIADIFGKMIRSLKEDSYKLALRETHTYDVIHDVETAYSDIGILAIKENDGDIMKRYLNKKGLVFTPFLTALPHVFVRKEHPAAKYKKLNYSMLKEFPYVSYEQGDHDNSFFAEEITGGFNNKDIEISDRASLMNVLLSTDCYTIGTGIMPSVLNNGNIVSIAFESDDSYTIGYIVNESRNVSSEEEKFIELLEELKNGNK